MHDDRVGERLSLLDIAGADARGRYPDTHLTWAGHVKPFLPRHGVKRPAVRIVNDLDGREDTPSRA